MKSTTSFYNMAIIRSNLKRFGFISILFFIINTLIADIAILSNILPRYDSISQQTRSIQEMMEMNYLSPWDMFVAFLIPFLLGIILFRFIQDERALSSIHAFPVSRKSLFISKFISFEIIFGIPVILNGFIALSIILIKGYPVGQVVPYVIGQTLILILVGNGVFGLTVLFGQLVGSSILQAGLALVMMGAPVMIVESIRLLLDWTLKGFPGIFNERAWQYYATPYYSFVVAMTNSENSHRMTALVITIIVTIAAIGFAYIFYQRRALESHHDLLVNGIAKRFFVGLLTLMATLGFAGVIGGMMEGTSEGAYIGLITGSLLGYSIMKMIAEKTLNVFKYYRQALLAMAVSLIVLVAVDLDVTGYETRLPEEEDVAFVLYSEQKYQSYNEMMSEPPSLVRNGYGVANFESAEAIEAVRDLHQTAIDGESGHVNRYIDANIIYVLKNGRRVHRIYDNVNPKYVKPIHETAEYRQDSLNHMEGMFYSSDRTEVQVRSNVGGQPIVLGSGSYAGLIAAYRADFMNMTYEESVRDEQFAYIEVIVTYRRIWNGRDLGEERDYYNFAIRPSFTNTIAWMNANGMEDGLPTAENVRSVEIRERIGFYETYDYLTYDKEAVAYEVGNAGVDSVITDNPELVQELFELGHDTSRPDEKNYVVSFYYGEGHYSFRVVDLPDKFLPYVNAY